MNNPFGTIQPPDVLTRLTGGTGSAGMGLGNFLNIMLKLMIVAGGVYALFKIIFAGYSFITAGNDPQKIEAAWAKIYESIIGLVIIAGSFVLAAIFGQILFGDYGAIINPTIPTLNQITP